MIALSRKCKLILNLFQDATRSTAAIHFHGEQIDLGKLVLDPLTFLVKEDGCPVVVGVDVVLIQQLEGGEEAGFCFVHIVSIAWLGGLVKGFDLTVTIRNTARASSTDAPLPTKCQ